MSRKFEKNKTKKKRGKLLVFLLIAIAAVAVVAAMALRPEQNEETAPEILQEIQSTDAPMTEVQEREQIFLKNELEVLDIGSYTGVYMEDGSDDIVSGILMMKLTNHSVDTVEYAKITMDVGGDIAEFTVSTLKPGATIVLLEKNRIEYDQNVDYFASEIVCENLAVFQEPLSLQEEKLKIQILDGAINVINVSDADIPGRITIYYKNKAAGVYYGGITYRVILENGLQADEIQQMMAAHFSDTGSELLFVTISQ